MDGNWTYLHQLLFGYLLLFSTEWSTGVLVMPMTDKVTYVDSAMYGYRCTKWKQEISPILHFTTTGEFSNL